MKKLTMVALLFTMSISYAQKKSNGTVYINHPAIDVVDAYTKTMNSGDLAKLDAFFADDFKAYNSTTDNQYSKGQDKTAFLKRIKSWRENIDYLNIKTILKKMWFGYNVGTKSKEFIKKRV